MSTPEQPTCGKGLAENSVLPAKLGELLGAMAENLETHMPALDLTDPHARDEYEAYEELVQEFRQITNQLQTTASHMSGYRDLPMGRHDQKVMTHPRVRESFEKFVKQKQALLSFLKETAERDDKLLETMHVLSH